MNFNTCSKRHQLHSLTEQCQLTCFTLASFGVFAFLTNPTKTSAVNACLTASSTTTLAFFPVPSSSSSAFRLLPVVGLAARGEVALEEGFEALGEVARFATEDAVGTLGEPERDAGREVSFFAAGREGLD